MIRSLACLLVASFLAALHGPARATEPFPSKPVRIVVGVGPGSVGDVRARWLGQRLSTALGQPVIVENRVGAHGSIAADSVAKSAPDGYTLLFITMGTLVLPEVLATSDLDPIRDFVGIGRISKGYAVLTVHPQLPAQTVSELVRMARENPGKLNYGSTGVGAPPWMAAELFRRLAAVDVTHVQYKGGGEVLADLIGGRIDYWFEGSLIQLPHIRAGKIRALAVTSPERMAALPDVPTLKEAGIDGYDMQSWTGLAAPAGTPPAVVERLNADMARIFRTREAIDWLRDQGNEPAIETPAEFAEFLRAERRKWSPIVRDAAIKTRL
jgi:tripartite-type tricarboxylate transporter receptor subunit TctC